METFLLGLIFGVAIGVWISVAIIEWRLPERKPSSMTRPTAAPPGQPDRAAAVNAPPSRSQPAAPATPAAPPPTRQTNATTWTPAISAATTRAQPSEVSQPAALSPEEQRLYSQLLNMAQGDRAKTDQLIEYERSKSPAASTERLIGNAIDRWLHDNR